MTTPHNGSEDSSISEGDLEAWRRIIAATMLTTPRLEADLQKAASLSMFEYQVLSSLDEADGPLTMTELAIRCNSSLSRLSHVARKIEGRDLIIRTQAAKDKRVTIVELTDKGKELVQTVEGEYGASLRRNFLDQVTTEELKVLEQVATKILDVIANDHPVLSKDTPPRNIF